MPKKKKAQEAQQPASDTVRAEEVPEELALETPQKMTIYDYERKYSKRQNVRGAKFFLRLAATLIGVFLFVILLLVVLRIYELNEIAGYASAAVALLLFVLIFVVPVVKIFHAPYFETNVNSYTAANAKRHNRKTRRDIADKIIHLTASVDGVAWYDSEVVGRLAIARNAGDDEKLKEALTELYSGSVKKSAKSLIFKASMRSAMYSALSQSEKIDAALIVFTNLQLIKDLVFLYGFRPSDAKLAKIFVSVIKNSLVALSLGGLNVGNAVVKTMGDAVKGIPVLGSLISTIVDSSVQGLANGTLTALIGYQTIHYLNTEYRLQNILDGVDVSETEEELKETCSEIETQLRKKKKLATAV